MGIKNCNPQILFCKNRTAYNCVTSTFKSEILKSENTLIKLCVECKRNQIFLDFLQAHLTVKLADVE